MLFEKKYNSSFDVDLRLAPIFQLEKNMAVGYGRYAAHRVGKTGVFLAKQGDSMQFGTLGEKTGKSLQPVKKQGDAIKQQNGGHSMQFE